MRCADGIESLGTGRDSQKNKLPPSTEMLNAAPLVQLPAVNCRELC